MKKAMNWIGVTSSAIAAVDYHKDERVLFVLFKAGSIHAYHDVSEYKFKTLIESDSVGQYFNRSIKPEHPETKEL
jgi:hypothetical protein